MASKSYRSALLAAVTMLLWIGGCRSGTGSVANLRDASNKAYSFEVAADYQTVHERILLRARQRYAFAGVPTHQLGVSVELSPAKQSSTITLWDSGGIGIRYRLRVEILAIDADHTEVELYATTRKDRQEARLWAAWSDTPMEK
jgi:hypothetical protein